MKLDTTGLESAAPVWSFLFDGFQKEAIQMVKPAKGTTTLAFIFKEGVMVAADSRASMGGYIWVELCRPQSSSQQPIT
ncbi:Proteasome subunit beta type-5-B [Hibiscus syriacus]|uniref:Proteasome subunit beta type-5-B n=1 Tax=Hibiscus syriacus TaxID=106335 RepID=A0A6A2WBX5_HIBSY|nr:Proteasome subunit beta type-5-B [Hibiscus syriacus]